MTVAARSSSLEPARELSTTAAVIAYRRPRALARLLDALDGTSAEVLVVNVGDDRDVEAVARAARMPVRVLPVGNRGFGAAVNAAATAARGEILVFTNDDAVVSDEVVSALADAVLCDRADVALPGVVDRNGRRQGVVQALPTPGRLLVEWALLPDRPVPGLARALAVEKWRCPEGPEPVTAGSAVTVAVRTEVLRTTPMPEHYFLYWEELEWFWWLRERGCRVALFPDVTVVHDGGRSDVRPEKSRLLARNAVRCVRRTQGRRAALLAYGAVILWNARLVAGDALRCRRTLRARLAGLRAAVSSWREVL